MGTKRAKNVLTCCVVYGESIENVGNRNTRPVVAKGSDDSVFTNSVVSAKKTLTILKGGETKSIFGIPRFVIVA